MGKAKKVIVISLAVLLHLVLTVISQDFLFYHIMLSFWISLWTGLVYFLCALLPMLIDFFVVRRLLRGYSFTMPRSYVLNLFDAVFLLPDAVALISTLIYIFSSGSTDSVGEAAKSIGKIVVILLCTVCVDVAYFAGRIKLSRRLRA